ncbi:triple tyrosine motif-containing protein [Niastella yeongjuensis]|nr:triple tyrosine motif-containing protein [Niastella yeongjuensis]SEN40053.1 DNA-binding transcriptional regulator, CsgD family [Niastella yeongjuensis]
MMRKLLLAICCFRVFIGHTQNTIGLPEIINYPKQIYNAGTQNWKLAQDKKGIVYAANDEGLLSFDGSFWKKYTLPGGTGVRSLAVGNDGRIYIGSQGEIGYFEPGKNGRLQYRSLNDLIPENEKDFTDIWDVVPVGNEVFFRSYRKIFQLQNDKITVFGNPAWSFLGLHQNKLISKAWQKGLLQFKNGTWVPFSKANYFPEKAEITAIVPLQGDSSLLLTKHHGSYILHGEDIIPFETPDMRLINEKNPYSAAVINQNQIAIITNLAGCFIINDKGELVQRLSKLDGLQSNNILSVFVDGKKNIWLGLDNGIDFIAYNNAIKHIYPDYQEHSSGKAAVIFKNDLYIGTSNGVYAASLAEQKDMGFIKSKFELIPGPKGQVWNLSELNGQLVMGHNDGFFVIENKTSRKIDSSSGFWTFLPLSNVTPSPIVMAGTYNGLNFYSFTNGKFNNPEVHTHFESARFVAVDNDIAWAAHPYKGLYKIILNTGAAKPPYTVYKDTKGILSSNNNHIFKIKSRVVLTNDKGIFEYNARTDDFEPSAFLQRILPKVPIRYLREDNNGNIWFVHDRHLGVADLSEKQPQIIYFPELNNKITGNGLEFVYPYDSSNVFIAAEEGFYLINYNQYKQFREDIPIQISDVRIVNKRDSTIFGGYFNNEEAPKIQYAWNSIHFDYSSPLYGKQSSIEFSYYLEDFDNGWSVWTKKNEKDYTYLSPGTYTFKVKARTHEGRESVVVSYKFTILAPWYRSRWAYFFYTLLSILFIYAIYKWQMKKFILQQQRHDQERQRMAYLHQLEIEKHQEEQKQLTYLHQLELERNEKEIIRLQNEKLQSEIQVKNNELASTTFNLVQKGEMLMKVKEEFVRMKKSSEIDKETDDYKKILRMLGDDKMKRNWEQFAVHFDKVHSNFLVSLKSTYPYLTASDLKLCAYLRLNLTSKEIAQIMNITIKGVELGRHRLRKKLGIQPEVNLVNFLLNFHTETN